MEVAGLRKAYGAEEVVPGTRHPSPVEEWDLRTVGAMSGEPFDAAYAYLEVQDRKQDIEESNMERGHGLNAAR